MRWVACLVLCAAGCAHRAGEAARQPPATPAAPVAGCQAWPATYRYALTAGPDGNLYWIERLTSFGYTRTDWDWVLVRWDRVAPPQVLTRRLLAPFRVLPDGRVIGVYDGVVTMWSDGEVWLLSSGDHAAEYLEVAGDADMIVYRTGDDLYRQPLAFEVATWIGKADGLLGAAGRTAFVRRGDGGFALDLARPGGRPAAVLGTLSGASAVRGTTVISSSEDGLEAWPVGGGAHTTVLAGDDWNAALSADGIAAWRPSGGGVEAAIVAGREPTRLPRLTGVDAVDSFVRLPDGTAVFLVPHDTDNDGDLSASDETDVCVVPAGTPSLAVTARHVPARRRARAATVEQAVRAAAPGAEWGFNGAGDVPGVWVRSATPLVDREARIALVARLAEAITAAAGDATLDVYLADADGRRATSEWQPWSHHRLRFAGQGRALTAVLADAETRVVVDRLERTGDKLECAGSIINQSPVRLPHVQVECTDGGQRVDVDPPDLAPGATGRFAGTTSFGDGEDGVAVLSDYRAVLSIQPARLQEQAARTAAAEDAFDRSRLTVWGWKVEGPRLVLDVSAPDDFGKWSHTSREMAAATGLAALTGPGPTSYGAAADTPIALRIRAGDQTWWYDGNLTEIE